MQATFIYKWQKCKQMKKKSLDTKPKRLKKNMAKYTYTERIYIFGNMETKKKNEKTRLRQIQIEQAQNTKFHILQA